jgi:hypothetical protein
MRNDARPIGHDAADSTQTTAERGAPPTTARRPAPGDARESVTHDRQSHVVNRNAEERAGRDDTDIDPVMPVDDSTLNTKI